MKKISLVMVFSLSVLTSNQFLLADDPQTRPGGCPDPPCPVIEEGKPKTKKVNINIVGEETLATLKGIGSAKAKVIIEYRNKNGPFKSVDDLVKVRGIGERTVAQIKDQVTVE